MNRKIRIKKYEITVLEGDISILCEGFQYATICGGAGMQCNFPPESEEYRELERALGVVAEEMKRIDRIMEKGGD